MYGSAWFGSPVLFSFCSADRHSNLVHKLETSFSLTAAALQDGSVWRVGISLDVLEGACRANDKFAFERNIVKNIVSFPKL